MPCRACPITVEILFGLCGALVQAGFRRDAFLALASYHLLLRTGEFLTLQAGDLMFRTDETVSVVRLRDTKGQKLKGSHEAVEVHDPGVARLLAVLAQGLAPAGLLMQSRSEYWRHRWNLAVRHLGLDDANVKAYSLRRGGATAHFREHGHYDRTVERGRWGNVATVRRYLGESVASLAELRLTPETRELLTALGGVFREYTRQCMSSREFDQSPLPSESSILPLKRKRLPKISAPVPVRSSAKPSSSLALSSTTRERSASTFSDGVRRALRRLHA